MRQHLKDRAEAAVGCVPAQEKKGITQIYCTMIAADLKTGSSTQACVAKNHARNKHSPNMQANSGHAWVLHCIAVWLVSLLSA